MENFLVDTDVLIDFLRGQTKAVSFIESNLPSCYVSYISLGEILSGVRDLKELKIVKKALFALNVDWGSESINKLAVNYLETYRLKQGTDFLDCIIAATAQESSCIVVTHHVKHFACIKNLKWTDLK